MNSKLFLDEDVPLALAWALRNRGVDALHVQEVCRKGKSDAEQLAYAVKQERSLVSFNVKDFVVLHNTYVQTARNHFGIIVSKQRPIGETLRRLLHVLQRGPQSPTKNRLVFL